MLLFVLLKVVNEFKLNLLPVSWFITPAALAREKVDLCLCCFAAPNT
jgi:hypothetical protein